MYSLLLTACIEPKLESIISYSNFRSNTTLRFKDYSESLKYWLNYSCDKIQSIVFVENSGYDLTVLKKIALDENVFERQIEFIQVEHEFIPNGLHYGYAELAMMDYAFYHSELLKKSKFIIKVTGRLTFLKLSALIKAIPINTVFLADSREYKFCKFDKHYLVTTLIIYQRQFYGEVLLNLKSKMRPHINSEFETLYFQELKPLSISDSRIKLRFPFNVNPSGFGAHSNKNYNSLAYELKNIFRGTMRQLFPKFKI